MRIPKLLLAVIVILFIGLIWRGCQSQKTIGDISKLLKEQKQQTTFWKDQDGRSHSQVVTQIASVSELQVVNEYLKDSLKDQGIKIKSLTALIKIQSRTSGSVTAALMDTAVIEEDTVDMVADTIGEKSFTYSDKFLSLAGLVGPDSVTIDYSYQEQYSIATHWKQQPGLFGFLKEKILVTEVTPENPKTIAASVTSIQIKPEPKTFIQTKGFAFMVGIIGGAVLAQKYLK